MQVKVSKKSGLVRCLRIKVPAKRISEEVEKRLVKLQPKVRLDGFRRGKVPANKVKQLYSASVREEVVSDVMKETYYEALTKKKLNPVSLPRIDVLMDEENAPLKFNATFEIYPEVKLTSFKKIKVQRLESEVTEDDVTKMLEKMGKVIATWHKVERAAKAGDQVTVDFVCKIDGKEFQDGSVKDFKFELGDDSALESFDELLTGAKAGDEMATKIKFPKKHHVKEMAGKKADLTIIVKEVAEPELPTLDEFAETFGIDDKGLVGLREEVREDMTKELELQLKERFREAILDELLDLNPVDLPGTLVEKEIDFLQDHIMKEFQKYLGSKKNFPKLSREEFVDPAIRRVSLGILLSEAIRVEKVKTDQKAVRTKIEDIASLYENPQKVIDSYYRDKERLSEIEEWVLEELVIDRISQQAKVTTKKVNCFDVLK